MESENLINQYKEKLKLQQGGSWGQVKANIKKEKDAKLKELLKNKPVYAEKTLGEKITSKINEEKTRNIAVDNTSVKTNFNASKVNQNARNKTDAEYATERKATRDKSDSNILNQYSTELFKPSNYTRENISEMAQGLDSKFRVSDNPNFFDDYLNPANMIGGMASNLGQAPLQAEQSDSYMPYITSVGAPLAVGALAGIGASSNAQFTNNLVNPLAGTGDLINTLGKKYLPNAYNLNPWANKEAYNTLYHNTNNLNFSLEEVDLLRKGSSQMKSKYANGDPNLNPSGFYTTDNPNSVFMGGNNTYSMQIPKNAKIADLKAAGRTTDRIPKQELLKLQEEGYDVIKGRNMLGLDEFIPLNKSKLSNWQNLGERVKDPSKAFEKNIFKYEEPHWLQGYKKMQQGGTFTENEKNFLQEIAQLKNKN
tara:strand:+ start:658 stop:1929 length:1272 start_codon:yes stop_codon:yes gene_type:complete